MTLEEAKMIFKKYFKDSKGKDFVMSVMDSIEIPDRPVEDESIFKDPMEVKPRIKPTKENKVDDFPQKPKKTKVCVMCGKEFHPNSGVQKYCNKCKNVGADISQTAREMLKG